MDIWPSRRYFKDINAGTGHDVGETGAKPCTIEDMRTRQIVFYKLVKVDKCQIQHKRHFLQPGNADIFLLSIRMF